MKHKNITIKTFQVVIEKDSPQGYHAWCPVLPGCHSAGETINQARVNIAEAIQGYVESLIARHKPIPGTQKQNFFVEHFALPINLPAKMAIA